jgi:uncharacterized protein YutE (UPF0331/DUF86 family)
VIDRDRLLAKLDELDGYLAELRAVAPERFEQYKALDKRRACERILQLLVQTLIDACGLLVIELRLDLPGEEDDLRNLLVHEYARINDEVVFETVHRRLGDFETFKREVLAFLRTG